MLHCKFSGDYNSDRIFKIGQYLTKLCVEHLGFTFFWPTLYTMLLRGISLPMDSLEPSRRWTDGLNCCIRKLVNALCVIGLWLYRVFICPMYSFYHYHWWGYQEEKNISFCMDIKVLRVFSYSLLVINLLTICTVSQKNRARILHARFFLRHSVCCPCGLLFNIVINRNVMHMVLVAVTVASTHCACLQKGWPGWVGLDGWLLVCANIWNFESNRTVTSVFDSIRNKHSYSKFSNTYPHRFRTYLYEQNDADFLP